MRILIQIREECDCHEGQRDPYSGKKCSDCKGKGYIDRYVSLSYIKDMLEELNSEE